MSQKIDEEFESWFLEIYQWWVNLHDEIGVAEAPTPTPKMKKLAKGAYYQCRKMEENPFAQLELVRHAISDWSAEYRGKLPFDYLFRMSAGGQWNVEKLRNDGRSKTGHSSQVDSLLTRRNLMERIREKRGET